MSAKSPRLTTALRTRVLSSIRSGGYLHVAAQAWGVSRETLDNWLSRGQGAKAREPFASFARDIHEAQGQARLRAEVEVFQNDPRNWLEHGPGRETSSIPGWSTAVKAAEAACEERNPWLDPELTRAFHLVLNELTPQPELRGRVAAILAQNAPAATRRAA